MTETNEKVALVAVLSAGEGERNNIVAWAEDEDEIKSRKDEIMEMTDGNFLLRDFKVTNLPHVSEYVEDSEGD